MLSVVRAKAKMTNSLIVMKEQTERECMKRLPFCFCNPTHCASVYFCYKYTTIIIFKWGKLHVGVIKVK